MPELEIRPARPGDAPALATPLGQLGDPADPDEVAGLASLTRTMPATGGRR